MSSDYQQLDFAALSDKLLSDAYHVLSTWLPAGKLHGREYRVGNLNGESGESLAINIDTGVWKDFSTDQKGADLIDLYAAINKIELAEAAKSLGADTIVQKDMYLTGRACTAIPGHRLGRPTFVHEYANTAGNIIGYICRFEPPNDRKQDLPLTFWKKPDGSYRWAWKKWPMISPLFRVMELVNNPTAKVLVVEGEKKAIRAQALMDKNTKPGEWVVVGWCGGCKNVHGTDWSILNGRECWMWPDADLVGLEAAEKIQKILTHIKIVDICSITPHLPEHWDLGDAPDDYNPLPYMQDNLALKKIQPETMPALQKTTLPQKLEEVNGEYAVILRGSQVLIMRYWLAEDGHSRLVFLSITDFHAWHENNVVYIENDTGDRKQLKVSKLWMEWNQRQTFEEVYFDPGKPSTQKRYNLWRGFYFSPDPDKGTFELFLGHIYKNICQGDDEQYEWVIAWLADLVQKPHRKLGTALVLRGPMGIGKGAFANHVGKLLGTHYMTVTQKSQLTGKFNGHMADKVLMFVDEGFWDDNSGGTGTLRALITEPSVTIEMKGKDAVTLTNYTRFIVAANEDWVVPVGMEDERRFSVIDVGRARQRDTEYFGAIAKELNNGGYEALLHYLMNYQYDESLPRNILNTSALLEQKIHSMPDEIKWLYNCLYEETLGDMPLTDSLSNDIACDTFYAEYRKWCETMKIRPMTNYALPAKLKKAGLYLVRKRKPLGTMQMRRWLYELPDLSTLRRDLETALGGQIDWNIAPAEY